MTDIAHELGNPELVTKMTASEQDAYLSAAALITLKRGSIRRPLGMADFDILEQRRIKRGIDLARKYAGR